MQVRGHVTWSNRWSVRLLTLSNPPPAPPSATTHQPGLIGWRVTQFYLSQISLKFSSVSLTWKYIVFSAGLQFVHQSYTFPPCSRNPLRKYIQRDWPPLQKVQTSKRMGSGVVVCEGEDSIPRETNTKKCFRWILHNMATQNKHTIPQRNTNIHTRLSIRKEERCYTHLRQKKAEHAKNEWPR